MTIEFNNWVRLQAFSNDSNNRRKLVRMSPALSQATKVSPSQRQWVSLHWSFGTTILLANTVSLSSLRLWHVSYNTRIFDQGCFFLLKNKPSTVGMKRPPTKTASTFDTSKTGAANPPAKKERRNIFDYPELPKWEMRFYFGCWIGLAIFAWYNIWVTSRTYKPFQMSRAFLTDSRWPSIFGSIKMDATNYEYRMWVPYMVKLFPWLIGHSLIFNISDKLLGHTALWSPLMLIYWLTSCVYVTHWCLVALVISFGLIIHFVASCTYDRRMIWLTGLILLYSLMSGRLWSYGDVLREFLAASAENYLVGIIFVSYKLLQFLSFNFEFLNRPEMQKQRWYQRLFEMFWYSFYLPYLISLVVIYKNFPSDLAQRRSAPLDVKGVSLFAARILFWAAFIEVIKHFFYFDAIMNDPQKLYLVDLPTLTSIGYVSGQFFQIKYVLIFGIPALFAKIDRLHPPAGPICISRVALYSKMWRYFDRGLYDFFKEYVFMPICQPTFSVVRKTAGMLCCFGFVLVWHGCHHQYYVWIILNIIEIVIEQVSKSIYIIPAVKRTREKYMSDVNFRRILGWLQVFPVCFGLYAIFYFLGGSASGYSFVERIFWAETVTFHPPFGILVCIGYVYTQSCMEIERIQNTPALKKSV